ncbi:MAG: 6-bladed beta-propeller [Balneolia bacterium]|nr:6-bladed beta-propeller [Balneolia bacterium]
MPQSPTPLLFVLITIFILLGSGSSSEEDYDVTKPALPEVATLDFVERFRVSDPAENVSFNFIHKIHVLSDGNLVVQNSGDYRLYEFTQDGEFVSEIGSQGRGPGEFLEIWNSMVSPGDTLHVLGDNMSHKVFARSAGGEWEFIRERTIQFTPQEGLDRQIPEDKILAGSDGQTYGIFQGYDESMGGTYSYVSSISHDIEQTGDVSRPFLIADLIVLNQDDHAFAITNVRFFNAFFSYLPDSDEVILVKNNSNEILFVDASGNETVRGYLPFEQVPLNMDEVNGMVNYYRNEVPGSANTLRNQFLEHEPYYWRVLQNDDRLFVHFERSEKDKPDWVITTLDGEVMGSFHIHMYIQHLAVNGNRLFVSTTGDDGTVYLAGFDLVDSGS